jgi:hypothetical protein
MIQDSVINAKHVEEEQQQQEEDQMSGFRNQNSSGFQKSQPTMNDDDDDDWRDVDDSGPDPQSHAHTDSVTARIAQMGFKLPSPNTQGFPPAPASNNSSSQGYAAVVNQYNNSGGNREEEATNPIPRQTVSDLANGFTNKPVAAKTYQG